VNKSSNKNTLSSLTGETSIENLFDAYYPRLCYFAFKLIDDQAAAEDVAQDAFVKYWGRLGDFANETAAKTYLYTTVKNACLNIIRHDAVKKKYLDRQDKNKSEKEKGLHQLIEAEVMGEIHKAIEELPQGCRQVLKLAYFEKLKNEEIASHLNVSVNTVKTQKARALQLLRLKLDVGAFILVCFTVVGK
jgi:RNA polymerase sigma-70 factor (ECF subfamily)